MGRFFVVLFIFLSGHVEGQTLSGKRSKPVIDSSVFDRWPAVGGAELSRDGRYVLYGIDHVGGGKDGCRVLSATDGSWRDTLAGGGEFSGDGRWLCVSMSGDSLCLVDLDGREKHYTGGIGSFRLSADTIGPWLACMGGEKGELRVWQLGGLKEEHFSGVDQYGFMEGGVLLWEEKDSSGRHVLHRMDLAKDKDKVILKGQDAVVWPSLIQSGDQLAFVTKGKEEGSCQLWYYRADMEAAVALAGSTTEGVDSGLVVGDGKPLFSEDGQQLFFRLQEKKRPEPARPGVMVDIWHYKDNPIQAEQLMASPYDIKTYLATIPVKGGTVMRLQQGGDKISNEGERGHYRLLYRGSGLDSWWQQEDRAVVYLEDNRNGKRVLLKEKLPYRYSAGRFQLSPDEGYIVYYNPVVRNYYSYEISSGRTRNLTVGVKISWKDSTKDYLEPYAAEPVGIAGMLSGDSGVLVYDNYDIWLLDLSGKQRPENITGGYGRRHHIRLRLLDWPRAGRKDLRFSMTLLLRAINRQTKEAGFYRKVLGLQGDPEPLVMGPYSWEAKDMIKAAGAGIWAVSRCSAEESVNWYVTEDFKAFRAVSAVYPEQGYNWIRSELVSWKLPDGKLSQGILYRPENFDTGRKYPLLLNYYEQRSDEWHDYLLPEASVSEINIPYFVSRGYVVFQPDIHYQIGYTGESAKAAVESAALYLSGQPWVDSKRIGIDGHSFGGFETNYIVTHSHLFAAAASGSGESDMISSYGAIRSRRNSNNFMHEVNQYRMRVSLWQRPDLYLSNSPVLSADKITTPLLLMSNKGDDDVLYTQGLELYLALRRLGKRIWLLQYDQGGHLVFGREALDYTLRLEGFFDYYLKGTLAPRWMTEGVPATRKGIDTGYELDRSGKKP